MHEQGIVLVPREVNPLPPYRPLLNFTPASASIFEAFRLKSSSHSSTDGWSELYSACTECACMPMEPDIFTFTCVFDP